MDYRVSFHDRSGAAQGQGELRAENDADAVLLAEIIFDACSDVSSAFQLWHGDEPVQLHRDRTPRPAENVIQVTSRAQESLIRTEELISNSRWMIGRSQRLLARLRLLEEDVRKGRASRLRKGIDGTGWQVLVDGPKAAPVAHLQPEVLAIARSMIEQHGADAARVAEKAAANVRTLEMQRMVRHWENVAAAIRAIDQKSPESGRG